MKCEMVHFKLAYSLIKETLNYPQKILKMRKWALTFVKSQERKIVKQFRQHYMVIKQYYNDKQAKNAHKIVTIATFLHKSIFGNFPCHQEKHAVWTGTVNVLKQMFIGYAENPLKTAYLSAQKKTPKTVKRKEKNIVHKIVTECLINLRIHFV